MPMLLKLSKKPIVSNAIKTNKLIFIAIINPFFSKVVVYKFLLSKSDRSFKLFIGISTSPFKNKERLWRRCSHTSLFIDIDDGLMCNLCHMQTIKRDFRQLSILLFKEGLDIQTLQSLYQVFPIEVYFKFWKSQVNIWQWGLVRKIQWKFL